MDLKTDLQARRSREPFGNTNICGSGEKEA